MDLENLLPALHIRQIDVHLTIKPPRPHQRRIQHILAVGRGDNDDPFRGIDAVHLHE